MHFQTKNKYEMIHKNTNLDIDGNFDIDRIIFQNILIHKNTNLDIDENFDIDRIILLNILIVSRMNFAMHRILFRKRILGTLIFIVPHIVFERLFNLTASVLGSR